MCHYKVNYKELVSFELEISMEIIPASLLIGNPKALSVNIIRA